MEFSTKDIVEFIKKIPETVIAYQIKKDHTVHSLYYSEKIPELCGISDEEYRELMLKATVSEKRMGDSVSVSFDHFLLPSVTEESSCCFQTRTKGKIYFQSRAFQAGETEEGPVMAVVLEGISQQKSLSSREVHREIVEAMIQGDGQNICALYMDVMNGEILQLLKNGSRAADFEGHQIDVWLKSVLFPGIPSEEKREELRTNFASKELLRRYTAGNQEFSLVHGFDDGNKICAYKMTTKLLLNIQNNHVEACVTWKDVTRDYVDYIINRTMYNNDYIALGVINTENHTLYIRSHRMEGTVIEPMKSYPYEACLEMLGARIHRRDQEYFMNSSGVGVLLKAMNGRRQHSFTIHNNSDEAERYSYYWFDKRRKLILLVVESMVKELDTDSLTGYLNRSGFMHHAESILKANSERKLALLYVNIQRFKAVNDLLGYEAGDQIICEISNNLQSSFLKPLIIARMEADHFVLLVDQENLELDRMVDLLHLCYNKAAIHTDIYARCGIRYIDAEEKVSISDLCDQAKIAKGYIPNNYIQPYSIYNEKMKIEYEQRSIALINLENAIRNEEFQIYYQPVVDAKTEKIISAEALIRWISPTHGIMLPGNFIPALEESGYITMLDEFVNRKVYEFLTERSRQNKKILPVAVNLSRMDLMDMNIMNSVLHEIQDSELPRNVFHYEITESAYAEITDPGMKFLEDLHDKGAVLLVDDFGSGISSLSTVQDYAFDVIKLDIGFIRKIGNSSRTENIIAALISLAHHLNMKVIAEGVETEEQIAFLRKHECDYFQGFYFFRPFPQEEFERMLDRMQEENE